MDLNDIRTELYKFNSEDLLSRVREKYNTPSFFEMIDKTRSESSHSAFLRWMLSGQGISETTADTPLFLFLNLLAKRSLEQESNGRELMNKDVRDAILSRKIKLTITETATEKRISQLAEIALDTFDHNKDKTHREYLSSIIASVADRVDVVVRCDVENCDNIKHITLIIENKVDSKEGDAKVSATKKRGNEIPESYKKKFQTERYYDATHYKNNADTAVIYVFLTPKLTNEDLLNLANPQTRDKLKKESKCAQCDVFININYQDILDNIIEKLLALDEGSITSRTRMFLSEYKNEITFPHIINPKKHVNIAHPGIKRVGKIWKKYRFLLHCIAYSCTNKGFAEIKQNQKTIFIETSNENVILDQLPSNIRVLFDKEQTSMVINKFSNILSTNNIQCKHTNRDSFESGILSLLNDYADNNLDILITLISDVIYTSPKYRSEAQKVYDTLLTNARDNTKYMVYYQNEQLTEKYASKSEVAFVIFKKYQEVNNASIDDMNIAFPVTINSYYKNGRYFRYLFYQYSSTGQYSYDPVPENPKGNEGLVPENWDFYRDKDHNYNGITNLKMWRKDAFESLLEHLKKEHNGFYMDLEITDTDGNIIT